jgi:RNA polymerase sigma factor for flagellar operon FliA
LPAVSFDSLNRYMGIVHQTVSGFLRRLPPNVLREDLVAAGTYGLMDSLRKHEGGEDPAFECYIRIRIRGAILDELRAQDWLPRRTRWAVSGKSKPTRASANAPTTILGFDDVPADDAALSLADECAPSPADAVEAAFRKRAVADAVGRLPQRERTIVQLHYYGGVKFKDIGVRLGVSEPRVSQLHSRAMAQLKCLLGTEQVAA